MHSLEKKAIIIILELEFMIDWTLKYAHTVAFTFLIRFPCLLFARLWFWNHSLEEEKVVTEMSWIICFCCRCRCWPEEKVKVGFKKNKKKQLDGAGKTASLSLMTLASAQKRQQSSRLVVSS
jgi:hypothetical protein